MILYPMPHPPMNCQRGHGIVSRPVMQRDGTGKFLDLFLLNRFYFRFYTMRAAALSLAVFTATIFISYGADADGRTPYYREARHCLSLLYNWRFENYAAKDVNTVVTPRSLYFCHPTTPAAYVRCVVDSRVLPLDGASVSEIRVLLKRAVIKEEEISCKPGTFFNSVMRVRLWLRYDV